MERFETNSLLSNYEQEVLKLEARKAKVTKSLHCNVGGAVVSIPAAISNGIVGATCFFLRNETEIDGLYPVLIVGTIIFGCSSIAFWCLSPLSLGNAVINQLALNNLNSQICVQKLLQQNEQHLKDKV